MTKKRKRGGKRPGAGAKRGNLNALKHGRYSTDQDLHRILAGIPPKARRELLPYLRASSRTIKRRLAWLQPPQIRHPKLLPFRPPGPSITTSTEPEQSKRILRLAGHGFIGAAAFLARHNPAATTIDGILDHLEQLEPDQYTQLRNPGGLVRSLVHEQLAEVDGYRLRCPYCQWTGELKEEAPNG
jgi:hypothetical protein